MILQCMFALFYLEENSNDCRSSLEASVSNSEPQACSSKNIQHLLQILQQTMNKR